MRREVLEETGLEIRQSRWLFEYRTAADVPCALAVFEAEARGTLRESWEGSPVWLPADEFRSKLLPSQSQIMNRIL